MTKKNIIKLVSFFILITVLTSIFSLPTFAEAESSNEVNNDEELLWWEQVGLFIFGVIFIILAIPIHILVGIYSIIKELIPMLAEFWASIF